MKPVADGAGADISVDSSPQLTSQCSGSDGAVAQCGQQEQTIVLSAGAAWAS